MPATEVAAAYEPIVVVLEAERRCTAAMCLVPAEHELGRLIHNGQSYLLDVCEGHRQALAPLLERLRQQQRPPAAFHRVYATTTATMAFGFGNNVRINWG